MLKKKERKIHEIYYQPVIKEEQINDLIWNTPYLFIYLYF